MLADINSIVDFGIMLGALLAAGLSGRFVVEGDDRMRAPHDGGSDLPQMLSDRTFANYDAIVDHCSDAWNKVVARPWTIMSIGIRDWAKAS